MSSLCIHFIQLGLDQQGKLAEGNIQRATEAEYRVERRRSTATLEEADESPVEVGFKSEFLLRQLPIPAQLCQHTAECGVVFLALSTLAFQKPGLCLKIGILCVQTIVVCGQ
ncbi:hypothetical protein D3C84_648570 [compost metagenome]